jgi:hypothetical protein
MRTTTITIRMDEALRKALEERARERGTTVSEVAREIMRKALDDRPMRERIGHLRGSLSLDTANLDGWRKSIYERNWRK